jgi:putative addiction module CopG family antidote
MEIQLTQEQHSFIDLGIKEGRFRQAEEAVEDALALWVSRERARLELLAAIDAGANSFDGSETVLDSEEAISAFVDGIKQRGRARLASL